MTPEERQLLNGLFERIGNAAAAPRDPEAEAFINEQVRARPFAPYLLTQSVIIQEEALKAAASRIKELETQLSQQQAPSEGGFLGGIGKSIFGGGEPARPAGPSSVPRAGSAWGAPPSQSDGPPPPASGPWGRSAAPQGGGFGGSGGGGGFLRGAMTTAAGVAGGALLYQGISSLFSGQHASGLLSDASGAAGEAGGLGNELFGGNSLLGGAEPASAEAPADTGEDHDPGIHDAGYDDSGDFGGDLGGDDWV